MFRNVLAAIFLSLAVATADEPPLEMLIGTFPENPSETAFRQIEKRLEVPGAAKNLAGARLAAALFLGRVSKAKNWPVQGTGEVNALGARIASDGRVVNGYLANEQQLSPDKINLWWMEYFASGDTTYLDKIAAFAGRAFPKDDATLWALIRAANGSFKINSGRFSSVTDYVKRCLADPEQKDKAAFWEECLAAGPVTKVVYRHTTPDIAENSFAARPKTFFRAGKQFARTEEEADPAMNLKGLLVANGRDLWMANLQTGATRHVADAGPTFEFFAPLVPFGEKGGRPRVREFQMGSEREFMQSLGIKPVASTFRDKKVLLYETTQDGFTLKVFADPDSGVPLGVSVTRDGRLLAEIVYESYESGLPFDRALFLPPPGLAIKEAD